MAGKEASCGLPRRRRAAFGRLGGAALALSLLAKRADAAVPFGIQAGGRDDGSGGSSGSSTYATGMFFDADLERLHVVGSAYGAAPSPNADPSVNATDEKERQQNQQQQPSGQSACFLSSLQLPQPFRSERDGGRPAWVRHGLYGAPDANSSTNASSTTTAATVVCSSVFMGVSRGIRTYFLAGYSSSYPDFVAQDQGAPDDQSSSSSSRWSWSSTADGGDGGSRLSSGIDVHGFAAELDFAARPAGGRVLDGRGSGGGGGRAHYPVAVVGNGTEGRGLVVATVHSSAPFATSVYRRYLLDQNLSEPDPDATGAFLPPRFERGCSVTLSGWEQTRLNDNFWPSQEADNASSSRSSSSNSSASADSTENLRLAWTKDLKSREGDSVFLSSLVVVDRPGGAGASTGTRLLAAGYTAGTGQDFGEGRSDGTLDSFVTALDPHTGATVRSMRLQSRSNSTDLILGLCAPPPTSSSPTQEASTSSNTTASRNESSYFYVVGMSNERAEGGPDAGVGSYKTFVLKLDADTFQLVWTAEIRAVAGGGGDASIRGDARGVSCAVTRDGAVLYVAGTVTNGASLALGNSTRSSGTSSSSRNDAMATVSRGGDDIFVAQLRAGDGSVRFLRQIGTPDHDWVASGECLSTDNQGNALVLGNTRGSMFRSRSASGSARAASEVVVFSVSRSDGSHVEVVPVETNATGPAQNATVTPPSATAPSPTAATNTSIFPTPAPSVNTSSRHDGSPPFESPEWGLRRNRTEAPFNPANGTNRTSTNSSSQGDGGPFNVEPYTPPAAGSGATDAVLIAAIAVLIVIIGASCVALLAIRSNRRRRRKELARSLSNAEDPEAPAMPGHRRSGSSLRWTSRIGRDSWGSCERRPSRRASRYNTRRRSPQDQDPTETSSCGASCVSGETLRAAPPRPDPLDADTLLRLDPSLRSLGTDGDEEDSYAGRFDRRIEDEDLYHPSVALNSVGFSSGGAARTQARESVEQWDAQEDSRGPERAFVMAALSSNGDDGSLLDSDTIPTSREGDEVDSDESDDDDTSESSSGRGSLVEAIDGVPPAEEEDGASAFDPSTLATHSAPSAPPPGTQRPPAGAERRARRAGSADTCSSNDNSTRYSVDVLFSRLRGRRRQRGVDPEPARSADGSGATSCCERGDFDDDDASFETRGVLS
jgi:hypothetical protein